MWFILIPQVIKSSTRRSVLNRNRRGILLINVNGYARPMWWCPKGQRLLFQDSFHIYSWKYRWRPIMNALPLKLGLTFICFCKLLIVQDSKWLIGERLQKWIGQLWHCIGTKQKENTTGLVIQECDLLLKIPRHWHSGELWLSASPFAHFVWANKHRLSSYYVLGDILVWGYCKWTGDTMSSPPWWLYSIGHLLGWRRLEGWVGGGSGGMAV